MIKNPKIGDYVWFICRWTDLPTLGVIATLGVDPPNKDSKYERPYAEIDWNGGNTPVLLQDLYETKQELLTAVRKKDKKKWKKMVSEIPVLSNPKHGWCTFTLNSDEGVFCASLSYLTDVMYDTLKMCLTYLKTGAAAVMYDREGEGTFLFVMSDYDVYVLDENLESGMVHYENMNAADICQNILDSYYSYPVAWINFANMEDQDEAEYKKYEDAEAKEIHWMIKEIRRLLNEKTGMISNWTEVCCQFFDEEEQAWLVDAWNTGDDDEESVVVAKIYEDGRVIYLDNEAENDQYVCKVVDEMLKNLD